MGLRIGRWDITFTKRYLHKLAHSDLLHSFYHGRQFKECLIGLSIVDGHHTASYIGSVIEGGQNINILLVSDKSFQM